MKPIHPRRYSNRPTQPEPLIGAQREILFFVGGMMFAMVLDLFFRGLGA